MPSFIVAGISSALVAAGASIITVTFYATAIFNGALLLGSMALSSNAKRKAERQARAQYNAAQVDRLANFPATVAPRELVLGRVRKGGHVFFRGSVGSQREKFVMLIAIAGHEIDAVEQIWLNDIEVTLDADGWVQTEPYLLTRRESASVAGYAPANAIPGTIHISEGGNSEFGNSFLLTSYQYLVSTSKARITVYRGAPGQTADAGVIGEFPSLWTSAHRADGIAYLKCEFFYDETAFPSGLPNVTTTIRGARCFDPRNGSTAWTQNPALQQRHILTHPYFGKHPSLSAAENARIAAAANACDIAHNYGDGAVPMYRSSIVLPFGTAARDGLDDLAQAMAGQWAYAGGEFFVRAGVYGAPVMALTEADLATVTRDASGSQGQQAISISTHAPRADRFNSVNARIWDEAQGYKQVTLAPVKGAALIAADGVELVQEIEMQGVFFAQQAQHIAGILMRDSRDPLTLTAAFKLRAYPLDLFDTITLTVPRYGFAAKEFMVLGRQWTLGGMVQLQLKETAAAIFQPNAAFVASGYADNTSLPRPWDIDPPASLSATSGTEELIRQSDGTIISRVRVSWPALLDAGVLDSGSVEVQWAVAAPVLQWQSVSTSGRDTQAVLSNAPDGQTVIIRARTRTTLAVSDWGAQIAHEVVGKTEPPTNVASVATRYNAQSKTLDLVWTEIADADIGYYEVRASDIGWGSEGAQFSGLALSCELPPIAATWFVRAFDTSGLLSAASASVSYSPPIVPAVTGITHSFADTSLTSATITLRWTGVDPAFGLGGYSVSYGGSTARTTSADFIELPADWVGNRTFSIVTVDRFGATSAPTFYPATKLAPAPVTNFRAQVIDNTVLLYWNLPARTSLPVAHVLLKKGATWATANLIGTKDGGFTTISELVGGNYTYWIATIDTDDNESAPVALATSVAQPPDFVFNAAYVWSRSGPSSNAFTDASRAVLPVNTTETWTQHFVNNGWSSPQAQINAGRSIYAQPGLNTGFYEETFDYGVPLASSSITVNFDSSAVAGTSNIVPTISTSLNGSTWTDYEGLSQLFAFNFRYIKLRLTVMQVTAGAMREITDLRVRLDSKLKTDSNTLNVSSSDTLGTVVNFGSEFVDVISFQPSPLGTVARVAVGDFSDNIIVGTYTVASNVVTVTATAHNLLTGQRVRLAASSGNLPIGVYTVASVTNANTYTCAAVLANTSGAVSTYPNSGRIYLYDSAGTRQSGLVSWTVRGS